MSDMIKDGTGSGKLVGVNSFNRLDVSAAAAPRVFYESRDRGAAFGITTPLLTVTTTGGRMLYIKNTSSTQNMMISDIRLDWNGGSTSFNKPAYGQIWFASEAPSANNTVSAAVNMNRSSVNAFDLDVEYWDEVGDGMTITGGADGFNAILSQGSTLVPVNGTIIVGINKTISFNLKAEEEGEGSIAIIGFMEDK